MRKPARYLNKLLDLIRGNVENILTGKSTDAEGYQRGYNYRITLNEDEHYDFIIDGEWLIVEERKNGSFGICWDIDYKLKLTYVEYLVNSNNYYVAQDGEEIIAIRKEYRNIEQEDKITKYSAGA